MSNDKLVRLEEVEAKKVLEKLFLEYKKLEIDDKPDLIDYSSGIGVEVTRAVSRQVEKYYGDFKKRLKNRSHESVPEKYLLGAKEKRVNIICTDDFRICGLYRIVPKEEIKLLNERIREKYNKKYKCLKTKDLYIFFRQCFIECLSAKDIESMFTIAHECEKENGKVFRKIFIDFYDKLLILDIVTNTMETIVNYTID